MALNIPLLVNTKKKPKRHIDFPEKITSFFFVRAYEIALHCARNTSFLRLLYQRNIVRLQSKHKQNACVCVFI